MSDVSGAWDTREFMRALIERLRIDGWLESEDSFVQTNPLSVAKAFTRAMDAALVGRAKTESPVPSDLAKDFLVETMMNKDLPLSERRHAAALLLQVKP